jgi:hypothetical protein
MSNRKGFGSKHWRLNGGRRPTALVVLNKNIVTSEKQKIRPRLERCTSRFQFWGPVAIKNRCFNGCVMFWSFPHRAFFFLFQLNAYNMLNTSIYQEFRCSLHHLQGDHCVTWSRNICFLQNAKINNTNKKKWSCKVSEIDGLQNQLLSKHSTICH